MSRNYIPIESIDDIDLSKIHVGNINDRYVDKQGNRYATRFNLRTRKIQLVRVALGEDEARLSKGRIVKGLVAKNKGSIRKEELPDLPDDHEPETESPQTDIAENPVEATTPQNHPPKEAAGTSSNKIPLPEWVVKYQIEPDLSADPVLLQNKMGENFKVLSERVFGVINNLQNAGVLTKAGEGDPMLALTTIFDTRIEPPYNKAEKLFTEMTKYPRKPEHYMVSIPSQFYDYIEALEEDDQLLILKAFLIGEQYLSLLEGGMAFTEVVEKKYAHLNAEEFPSKAKQSFEDAITANSFIRETIRENAALVTGWMAQQNIF